MSCLDLQKKRQEKKTLKELILLRIKFVMLSPDEFKKVFFTQHVMERALHDPLFYSKNPVPKMSCGLLL